MITAEQARRRADKYKKPVALPWGKLEKCIKDAADQGKYEALYICDKYDSSVREDLVEYLMSKGYQVEQFHPYTWLKIRWE